MILLDFCFRLQNYYAKLLKLVSVKKKMHFFLKENAFFSAAELQFRG
jgi:hypothetical protein